MMITYTGFRIKSLRNTGHYRKFALKLNMRNGTLQSIAMEIIWENVFCMDKWGE